MEGEESARSEQEAGVSTRGKKRGREEACKPTTQTTSEARVGHQQVRRGSVTDGPCGSLDVTSFVKCEELPVSQHQDLNPRRTMSVPSRMSTGVQGCSREGARQGWVLATDVTRTHTFSGCFRFTDDFLVSETILPLPSPE